MQVEFENLSSTTYWLDLYINYKKKKLRIQPKYYLKVYFFIPNLY